MYMIMSVILAMVMYRDSKWSVRFRGI